ncbi:MAG: hypothetical protein HY905_26855 [Deltaproteobacteria bacterium]|nr:hypothetical protein [Deltaproteobacteria bacterium]
MCPLDTYGPDRVVTQHEYDTCVNEARRAYCWCDVLEYCWDPGMPMPLSCTPGWLCGPSG